jgi:RES domain
VTSPSELEHLWRVGHATDPLAFTPRERCSWNHRFDDPRRRFRTLYFALTQETCLREVLADLRPNSAAIARFTAVFGPDAGDDLSPPLVPNAWRRQHVLAPATVQPDGFVLDLCDPSVRHDLERDHAALLAEHSLDHLDLHELTTRTRAVTRAIAADNWDDGAAVIRFPSSRDGGICFAALEHHVTIEPNGQPILLTHPPPAALQRVAADWHLQLEDLPRQ